MQQMQRDREAAQSRDQGAARKPEAEGGDSKQGEVVKQRRN